MSSLDDRLQRRDANNFDFLRLLAAACVLLSHCFDLQGNRAEPLGALTGYMGFGELGVSIFFFMSGMLVTRSWLSQPSLPAYLGKRALRIYPGLAAACLFGALVIGPLATSLPWSAYFSDRNTYAFLYNLPFPACRYFLPGVFTRQPFHAVNGSLWTLPLELLAYLAVLVCGKLRLLAPRTFPLAAAALLAWILQPYAALGWAGVDLTGCCLNNWDACSVYFLLGMAAHVYRRRLPMNPWLALLAAALLLGTLSTGFLGYAVSFASVPYLILYVGQARVPALSCWAKRGDLSYGLYIYAFPVQQMLIHCFGVHLPVAVFFASSLAITLALAFLSWHWVERPALALRWGQRREAVLAPAPPPPLLPPSLQPAA